MNHQWEGSQRDGDATASIVIRVEGEAPSFKDVHFHLVAEQRLQSV